MPRQVYYRYNPDTDNFERVFPTLRNRLLSVARVIGLSIIFGAGLFLLLYYVYEAPSERSLREENEELESKYNILNRRLEYSLKIMDNIRNRDDNFYRVMMQMEPLAKSQRYAGLDNEMRYQDLRKLSDAGLLSLTTRRMDLLERQLYAQSVSFNQLKQMAERQEDKLARIPSILPIENGRYTLSSGYGIRRDAITGVAKFHTGIDLAAESGTNVYASADGTVVNAERTGGYGNNVKIDHGYNYETLYAHLNEISVRPGQKVRKGDKIGTVGSTGRSAAPHLHYEVLFKNEAQNPVNYFFRDLSPEQYADMVQKADDAGQVLD